MKSLRLVLFLAISATFATAPAGARELRMRATAYAQHGRTAMGTRARRGVVAADPRVLPLGTKVRVKGAGRYSGVYRVEDTGGRIRGRKIDVFMPSGREARNFGRRPVEVKVLNNRRPSESPRRRRSRFGWLAFWR